MKQKVICILISLMSFSIKAQNVFTIAGSTSSTWAPVGVALDISGNIYFSGPTCIRKVDPTGTSITTISGSQGFAGYSGDGGLATLALLNSPQGLVVDSNGNIYIADNGNNSIRKIDVSGTITTIAGAGTSTLDGILASSSKIYNPVSITLDGSGNIYFNDGCRVRMINNSGFINTVAGNGSPGYSGDGGSATSAQLYNPSAIAFDGSGNLYIGDANKNCIRKVSTTGTISTVAGGGATYGDGGPATSAQVNNPTGLAIDVFNNIFISDGFRTIRKINSSGIISTIAGTVVVGGYNGTGIPASSALVNYPQLMATDPSGNLFFCDRDNNILREICFSSCLAGINELKKYADLKLFPNPVSNILNITTDKVFDIGTEVEITNTLGQIIIQKPFQKEIDVSQLQTGCYFLKIKAPSEQLNYKFIKE